MKLVEMKITRKSKGSKIEDKVMFYKTYNTRYKSCFMLYKDFQYLYAANVC